ncbi:GSU2403 family nucleotidyltransferase fold protein [Halorhodospira halophila]|uniref:GSU2403 family nucleotidyltransferase fold protein n=1 Tax=Halorhodospira halophila TaxID=1053 RepID=UPI001912272B|nr:GSU2403 family nucleotidyltransferase fold protein [Halorhodospira halophila]MBK5943052.1 hypothetical protein [Halorhodospira halophila]
METKPLSLTARTLFAELREQAVTIGVASDRDSRPGTVVRKSVKGSTYFYYQYRDLDGRTRQTYIGPDNEQTAALLTGLERTTRDEAEDREHLQKLRAAFVAAGGSTIDNAPMRVITAFAEAGIFRPGSGYGVLVGTLAFHAYANLLGVTWASPTRTQDIDVAGPSRIDLAIRRPEKPMPDILQQLAMGFIPVPALDPRTPSTSYRIRGRELRVDLLTPETGAAKEGTQFVPALNAPAQPLRFLDYLLEETLPVPLVGKKTLALVNLPLPERFALHKLLVSESRTSAFATKTAKDREQAFQLLDVLEEEAPDSLELATEDLRQRGPGWRQRLDRALARR